MRNVKRRTDEREFIRQHSLRQSWKQFDQLVHDTSIFLNRGRYKKDTFSWTMYITQLHSSFKSILKNNNVQLNKTPYRIITPFFNKLKTLSDTREILAELQLLIHAIRKNTIKQNLN